MGGLPGTNNENNINNNLGQGQRRNRDPDLENPNMYWSADVPDYIDHNDESFDALYLILLEARESNMGRYDEIPIRKLVARIIKEEKSIYVSGRNQVKIFCEERADANTLLSSETLKNEGYRAMIPPSLAFKKGFIKVNPIHSVSDVLVHTREDIRSCGNATYSTYRMTQRD